MHGFWKKNANALKDLCSKLISASGKGGPTEAMADALAEAVAGASGVVSVADELKKLKELLDSGVISQEEFDGQKKKLLE